MRKALALSLLVFGIAGATLGDIYRVRNTNDAGQYSLRWAITEANNHAGRDKILFARTMAGRVILPHTPLPVISDNRTIIDADTNDDGAPDVAINGKNLTGPATGLEIAADRCVVRGLAIAGIPGSGIYLDTAHYTIIQSCHVGVNLAGTKAVPNSGGDLVVTRSDHVLIGGTTTAERNVFSCGHNPTTFGIRLAGSQHATISGNYLGLTRDGQSILGDGQTGVVVADEGFPGTSNTIGGSLPNAPNVFAGLLSGVALKGVSGNAIAGNYFGLAADGDTLLRIGTGVMVSQGSADNTIGGTTAGERNVFAGNADEGVRIIDSGTDGNKVQGNYFGSNAAGTRQRRLKRGVAIVGGCGSAGPQIIGGGTPAAGNHFTPKSPIEPIGVVVSMAGANTSIRHNTFGVLPDGTNANMMLTGVDIVGVNASISDNTFARSESGIALSKAGTNPRIVRNIFRGCQTGVHVENDAQCRLGDLSNTSTADDGGNRFRNTNTWNIRNFTGNRIKAEGNDFSTTSRAAINAKIHDFRDDSSKGKVDFVPLIGGAMPTGDAPPLTVTAAAALPTRTGAEVVFSLSAPASVTATILNIAGRPVATIARDRDSASGMQRLVWSGRAGNGTQAPAGTYLVRIAARSGDGQQVQSVCTVALRR